MHLLSHSSDIKAPNVPLQVTWSISDKNVWKFRSLTTFPKNQL